VVVPVEAIAGAVIIEDWIALPTWQIGVVLMAIMTAVNLLSARAYGEFEFWFSSIKVAAIIAFILVAAAHAFGFTTPAGDGLANLTAHGGFAPKGAMAALAAVTTVIFSMMGAEIVTIAAVESPEPARAVARMSSSVITRILLFYVGSILMVLCVVPWDRIVPGESPFTLALDTMQIPGASTIMAWIILTAVLSCLNSAFYVCSRVLFVLAGHGDAPRWLVKTNKRQVPSHSVMLASIAGFAGVIASILSPSGVFAFLLTASGALVVYVYIAIAVSQIRVRQRNEREGKPPSTLPMWLFPWLSYLAIAGMVAVLLALAFTPARSGEFWASAATVAAALLAYAVFRRNRAG
jgi:L-asparagine transporter-like permease